MASDIEALRKWNKPGWTQRIVCLPTKYSVQIAFYNSNQLRDCFIKTASSFRDMPSSVGVKWPELSRRVV